MGKLIHSILALVVTLLVGCDGTVVKKEEPPRAPTEMVKSFLSTNFEVTKKVEFIQKGVRALIAPLPHPIANPGEPYSRSDVIEVDMPRQRLMFSGSKGNIEFALFEQGGFIPVQFLIIAKIENSAVTSYCRYAVQGNPKDLKSLKQLVSGGLGYGGGYKCQ